MEDQNRVTKVVLLAAGFVLVLCLGMAIGGVAVYGAMRLGDWLPVFGQKTFEQRSGDLIEEPSVYLYTPGARIVEVVSGSPAEQAGLQEGDTIVAVEGQPVGVGENLASLIGVYQPGDRVTLQVRRSGGTTEEVEVRLGENPDEKGAAYLGVRYSSAGFQAPGPHMLPYGGRQGSVPEELPVPLPWGGQLNGVVIVAVAEDSPAATAGLQAGDILTAFDDQSLDSPRALTAAIAEREPGERVTLTVFDPGTGGERQVEVTLGEHPDREGQAYLGVTLGGASRFHRIDPEGEGALPGFGSREGFFYLPRSLEELLPFQSPSYRQDFWREL